MLQIDEFSRVAVPHPLIRGSPLSLSVGGSSAFHAPMPTIFITAAPSQPEFYSSTLQQHQQQQQQQQQQQYQQHQQQQHQQQQEGNSRSSSNVEQLSFETLRGPDAQEFLMGGALVVDPALREEVSAVQLELQKQILVLQQEQQMQQQILLQHFQLQQRHLQQQHEKHLSERIRMYMESHKTRSDSSAHSDEDRDSGNGSDKDISATPQEFEKEVEPAVVSSPTPTATKCPKKDVLRKLEEEERMRLLIASKVTKTNVPKASTSPAPKVVVPPKKSGSGASVEVRAKLQQFLTKRQEQRTRTKLVPGIQRPRQKSSSSERSTTSSLSGSESPPAKATSEETLAGKPASTELSLKLKSTLRQKVTEGRLSPISKTEQKLKRAEINCHVPAAETRCRPSEVAPELPKQRKNEMFQMISMLLGQ